MQSRKKDQDKRVTTTSFSDSAPNATKYSSRELIKIYPKYKEIDIEAIENHIKTPSMPPATAV
jgi:hypothetical protein